MTSLLYSVALKEQNQSRLRRSDRKKTKRIFKDDFIIPNPFKGKSKKQRSLRLPENLDCQIKRIQFLTQRTLAMLNYGKQQFSVDMLNQMKQAVSQQQTKLCQFLQIKLIGEKNQQENRIYLNMSRNHRNSREKLNTPKIQENTIAGENHIQNQFQKQEHQIVTANDLYGGISDQQMQDEINVSVFHHEESIFCLAQVPKFRKESSKLFSDNYENNELLYTIDHLIPNWHKQEEEIHQEQIFMD